MCQQRDQIEAVDHAQRLIFFDNEHTMNMISHQQLGHIGDRRVGLAGDNLAAHHVFDAKLFLAAVGIRGSARGRRA